MVWEFGSALATVVGVVYRAVSGDVLLGPGSVQCSAISNWLVVSRMHMVLLDGWIHPHMEINILLLLCFTS